MHKYIIAATSHLKDSVLDARSEIYRAVNGKRKWAAESRNRAKLGELADMPVYSIPYPQIKKIAALKNHIWGL
jgi:hypothetical protein